MVFGHYFNTYLTPPCRLFWLQRVSRRKLPATSELVRLPWWLCLWQFHLLCSASSMPQAQAQAQPQPQAQLFSPRIISRLVFDLQYLSRFAEIAAWILVSDHRFRPRPSCTQAIDYCHRYCHRQLFPRAWEQWALGLGGGLGQKSPPTDRLDHTLSRPSRQ